MFDLPAKIKTTRFKPTRKFAWLLNPRSVGNLLRRVHFKYWVVLILLGSIAVVLAASTTTFRPYRTLVPAVPTSCPFDSPGSTTGNCAATSWERVPNEFDLFYVEFDDQGLLHPPEDSAAGMASRQLDRLDEALRGTYKDEQIELIVYVHGWKHNAQASDGDVVQFRQLLRTVADSERGTIDRRPGARPKGSFGFSGAPVLHRQVVGVFVGWRGLSQRWEPFKELSFWGRKDTSTRVAVGSARELFARLRAYQQMRNDAWDSKWLQSPDKLVQADPTKGELGRPPVRMLIIGHSFGAQLVFSSISESLIETLGSRLTDPSARIQRYGDMVILINPAFEASRFIPLFHMAMRRDYDHYLAPLLVSITTTSDWATKRMFPFGRSFAIPFEHFSSSEEKDAYLRTLGHLDRYITHELTLTPPDQVLKGACSSWKPLNSNPADPDIIRNNLWNEKFNVTLFFGQYEQKVNGSYRVVLPQKHWIRPFCGGTQLEFVGSDNKGSPMSANMPIWNIRTHSPIIVGHNGFETDYLQAFLRQLHTDATTYFTMEPFAVPDYTAQRSDLMPLGLAHGTEPRATAEKK